VRMRHPSVIATERVADAGRVQAWVCGSGLGTDEHGAEELRAVLAQPVPLCLDADALTLIAEEPRWRGSMVVTPHDREFARPAGGRPRAARSRRATSRMRCAPQLPT